MKKVFVFLPDGVGLKNFVFSNFYKIGKERGFNVVYWNNTTFKIKEPSIDVAKGKSNWLTDIFKRTRTEIELKQHSIKFNDNTYKLYIFPKSFKTIKEALKSSLVKLLTFIFSSTKGLIVVRSLIERFERKSEFYKNVKKQLIEETPDLIFSTNQRSIKALAPILAAKDLGIPTATFIFSWDNLPKATLVIETDYYFVWSDYMKEELIKYYPFITRNQIKVTGTPQFENHFNEALFKSKKDFYKEYSLDSSKRYICFSGDDITTSPYDQFYLRDLAKSVRNLNINGNNLGIVFRKCPVDFSNRYNEICEEYNDVIKNIHPLWKKKGDYWNEVYPTKDDSVLLLNTIKNCDVVINIGSSMVFDFITQNKPCIYINYNNSNVDKKIWDIDKIYKFIHFKSMPSNETVLWVNSKNDIESIVLKSLETVDLTETQKWFELIIGNQPKEASNNIWKEFTLIMNE